MTQEMLIMAAILVAVILLTFIGILSRYRQSRLAVGQLRAGSGLTRYSSYMVKREEIKSRQNYTTVVQPSYGLLFKATNSCP